ncbi:hypothetical protein KY306_00340 [Candidatus Woesearchaeota archaeon]|nr:hypothetical protein [Candidatus Woesearchaeota archaeon]
MKETVFVGKESTHGDYAVLDLNDLGSVQSSDIKTICGVVCSEIKRRTRVVFNPRDIRDFSGVIVSGNEVRVVAGDAYRGLSKKDLQILKELYEASSMGGYPSPF